MQHASTAPGRVPGSREPEPRGGVRPDARQAVLGAVTRTTGTAHLASTQPDSTVRPTWLSAKIGAFLLPAGLAWLEPSRATSYLNFEC